MVVALRSAIESLDGKQREVLVLRHYLDWSEAEIAEVQEDTTSKWQSLIQSDEMGKVLI